MILSVGIRKDCHPKSEPQHNKFKCRYYSFSSHASNLLYCRYMCSLCNFIASIWFAIFSPPTTTEFMNRWWSDKKKTASKVAKITINANKKTDFPFAKIVYTYIHKSAIVYMHFLLNCDKKKSEFFFLYSITNVVWLFFSKHLTTDQIMMLVSHTKR